MCIGDFLYIHRWVIHWWVGGARFIASSQGLIVNVISLSMWYRLHKNLTEHVNVEVVLNTITDMADAAAWLSHTLLHVHATKNPQHYGENGVPSPATMPASELTTHFSDSGMSC